MSEAKSETRGVGYPFESTVRKPHTVTLTVHSHEKGQHVRHIEHELEPGVDVQDLRVVVALVGYGHTGGAVPPGAVLLDEPIGDVAGVEIAGD